MSNITKFTVAFPFKYARAKFSIKKLSDWGVIDYIFLKELSFKSYSLLDLCIYSNLEKQIDLNNADLPDLNQSL